jgi:predicted N-acetyltransferase YhbS
MPSRTNRPYAGAADLQRMELALAHAYSRTSLRVGDISWLSREHTHLEMSLYIRFWDDDAGQLIAWTFFRPNGEFNVFVAPDAGHDADAGLFDDLLTVIEEAARASVAAGDPPVSLNTYGVDPSRSVEEGALAAALQRFGFQIDPEPSGVMRRQLDHVSESAVLNGYRLGWVQTRDHVIGRVEAHRAAFAPSDLTVRKYERLQRTWPYRPTLDRVALTDEGVIVAFCTAWLDEENAAGLLEPVGTHPAHRRRGLARAVCTDALLALRAAGARTAQVGFGSDSGYATYRSAGFERFGAELAFSRDQVGVSASIAATESSTPISRL